MGKNVKQEISKLNATNYLYVKLRVKSSEML